MGARGSPWVALGGRGSIRLILEYTPWVPVGPQNSRGSPWVHKIYIWIYLLGPRWGAVLGGPNPAIPLDFTPQSRIPRKSRTILAPIPHPAKEFCRSQNLQWFHYFGLFGGYTLRSSSNNNNKFALILRSDIALDYIKKYYQLLEWFNITDIELGVSILWVG